MHRQGKKRKVLKNKLTCLEKMRHSPGVCWRVFPLEIIAMGQQESRPETPPDIPLETKVSLSTPEMDKTMHEIFGKAKESKTIVFASDILQEMLFYLFLRWHPWTKKNSSQSNGRIFSLYIKEKRPDPEFSWDITDCRQWALDLKHKKASENGFSFKKIPGCKGAQVFGQFSGWLNCWVSRKGGVWENTTPVWPHRIQQRTGEWTTMQNCSLTK